MNAPSCEFRRLPDERRDQVVFEVTWTTDVGAVCVGDDRPLLARIDELLSDEASCDADQDFDATGLPKDPQ